MRAWFKRRLENLVGKFRLPVLTVGASVLISSCALLLLLYLMLMASNLALVSFFLGGILTDEGRVFSLIMGVLVLLGFILQYWVATALQRDAEEAAEQLRRGAEADPRKVRDGLDQLVLYPLKTSCLSLVLWAMAACLWFLLIPQGLFPQNFNAFSSLGILMEAIIAFPLQYYIFRYLVKEKGDYILLLKAYHGVYTSPHRSWLNIRTKLLISFGCLVAGSLFSLFISNQFQAAEGLKRQTINVGQKYLGVIAFQIQSRLRMGTGVIFGEEKLFEDIKGDLDRLAATVGARALFLVDMKENRVIYSKEEAGAHTKQEAAVNLERLKAEKELGREGYFEDPETQDLIVYYEIKERKESYHQESAAAPGEGEGGGSGETAAKGSDKNLYDWVLGAVFAAEDYSKSVEDIKNTNWVLIGITMAVVFAISLLLASDLANSLKGMANLAKSIGEGDLSGEVYIISEDEVGDLAGGLQIMSEELKGILRKIDHSSDNSAEVIEKVDSIADEVSSGSENQVISVEEMGESVDTMNASIRTIGENVEILAGSAEESLSSIFQMSAIIDEVASNVVRLNESVDETTSAVQEMVVSIRQVADNVEQLSSITEETGVSMEEMNSSIQEVENNALSTEQLSEQVSEDAKAGHHSVGRTIEGINRIQQAFDKARGVVHELGEGALLIGNILEVINKVAEQTNLLSLNASIIASQAGEQGKSFAVVAQEIRSLAERTSASTREIAALINTFQEQTHRAVEAMEEGSSAVKEGVSVSESAGVALEKILDSAEKSMGMVKAIAVATREQTANSERVMKNVEKVARMVGQIESATREQSRGSNQILQAAERMGEFAQLVRKTTQEQAKGSKQINKAIENITEMVRYINEAQREEIASCEKVSTGMERIKTVTVKNSDSAVELDKAVEVLKRELRDLKDEVDRFKSVNGDKAAKSSPEAEA